MIARRVELSGKSRRSALIGVGAAHETSIGALDLRTPRSGAQAQYRQGFTIVELARLRARRTPRRFDDRRPTQRSRHKDQNHGSRPQAAQAARHRNDDGKRGNRSAKKRIGSSNYAPAPTSPNQNGQTDHADHDEIHWPMP